MGILILAETSAGYALFKAKDKKLLKKDGLATAMSTPGGANELYVICCGSSVVGLQGALQVEIEGIREVR